MGETRRAYQWKAHEIFGSERNVVQSSFLDQIHVIFSSIPTKFLILTHQIHKMLFLFVLFCIYHITITMIITNDTAA